MNHLLGICIPTYKRPDQLKLCVESVIQATRPFDVPIFIADDSVDETNHGVLAELCRQYPYIIVSTNEENLGIDGNIVNSVTICTCQYAWMLGEDDRLLPDAVEYMLSVLQDNSDTELPFIFANYASVNAEIEYYLNERVLSITDNFMESAESFLVNHSWAAGFIGGCIVNKQFWSRVRGENYIGTYFAHVGIILEMIQGKAVLLIAKPLVLNRCGEPRLFTWSDSTFNVAGGWKKMIERLVPVYSAAACEIAVKQFETVHGLYSYRFLCYARADYAYRLRHYNEFIKPLQRGPLYQSIACTIACIPPAVFKTIRFFVTKYRQIVNPSIQSS